MSQAGIVDIEGSHPQIPTMFITNNGTAIPIANTLEILGEVVAAYGVPLQTTGSGSTVTVVAQYASASASSSATHAGLASFNSTQFTVDANGFVTLNGSVVPETITGNTGGPLSPVAGNWNIFGSAVAAGTTPVQTAGSGNTLTVQVQRSQAIASTNATNVGLAAFNSTYFTVDANGFVSINGSAIAETITGNTGGALSPTAGNWNILGTSTAAGSTPVQTAGSGSTLTVQVQKAQAIASTNAANVGLAAFSSAQFIVDANGFVTLNGSGSGETITGDTGGAQSPTAGNWTFTGGTTGLTFAGAASVFTVTGVLVGANGGTGANNVTTATGTILRSNGTAFVPSTATYPNTAGTSGNVLTSNGTNWVSQAPAAASISITGDSGGALTGSAFTITGGTTGLTFSGAGTTETLTGTLGTANGGTNATSFTQTNGIVAYNGTRLVNYAGPQLSSAGIATNTSQPSFFVYMPATTTAVTGDGTQWFLGTVGGQTPTILYDQNSNISNSGGTYLFTVPVTGKYLFQCSLYVLNISVAMTLGNLSFYNFSVGGNFNLISVCNPGVTQGTSNQLSIAGSTIIQGVAGQQWGLSLIISNGLKAATIGGAGAGTYYSYWSGFLIG
jgi:hypothetical protein